VLVPRKGASTSARGHGSDVDSGNNGAGSTSGSVRASTRPRRSARKQPSRASHKTARVDSIRDGSVDSDRGDRAGSRNVRRCGTDSGSESSEAEGDDADPRGKQRAAKPGFAGRAIAVTRDDGSTGVFITSQHAEYDHRGDDLRDASLFQWTALVQREMVSAPVDAPEVSVRTFPVACVTVPLYCFLHAIFRMLRQGKPG